MVKMRDWATTAAVVSKEDRDSHLRDVLKRLQQNDLLECRMTVQQTGDMLIMAVVYPNGETAIYDTKLLRDGDGSTLEVGTPDFIDTHFNGTPKGK